MCCVAFSKRIDFIYLLSVRSENTYVMFDAFLKVTMANREAAERACKDPNPIIDGRKANVNLAYLGAKPRGIQTGTISGTDLCNDFQINAVIRDQDLKAMVAIFKTIFDLLLHNE